MNYAIYLRRVLEKNVLSILPINKRTTLSTYILSLVPVYLLHLISTVKGAKKRERKMSS